MASEGGGKYEAWIGRGSDAGAVWAGERLLSGKYWTPRLDSLFKGSDLKTLSKRRMGNSRVLKFGSAGVVSIKLILPSTSPAY